ncbi:MAG: histidine phosphatase family protein [Pseudomonadota bacterium]
MTELGLLRHFPTDWNREARLQGHTDRPLDPSARAELVRLALPPPWDGARILASPLSRACDTANALADGRPVATDARLVEQSWGAWEGAEATALLADPSTGFVPTHTLPETQRAPGGESGAEVWARLAPLLVELGQLGGRILIVGHKAVMRLMLRRADPSVSDPEIKRARLYPLLCAADGRLSAPGPAVRLIARP